MRARFWEIDFLRGIAVMAMIFFHFFWDLYLFGSSSVEYFGSGIGILLARSIPVIFLLLAGIALTISLSRIEGKSRKEVFSKFFGRGAKLLCYALIITAITRIFFPHEFVIFGVLHLIGVSVIISQPFLKWKLKNLALGIAFIISGIILQNYYFSFPWLLWLGLMPRGFATFDYFPILPWFGFILVGICLGNFLYPRGKRKFAIKDHGKMPVAKQFCWIGRHSLLIYFLHQPALIAIILLLGV